MKAGRCALTTLAAALLLAACAAQQEPTPPPAQPAGPGACNAAPAQFAVGYAYGEAIAEEVRRRSGARSVRTIRPGQIVTMEYVVDRATLDLDAAGRVTRVRCG